MNSEEQLASARRFVARQDWKRAEALLVRLTRNDSQCPAALLELGQVLWILGKLRRSADVFHALLDWPSYRFQALCCLAEVTLMAGDLPAYKELAALILSIPDVPTSLRPFRASVRLRSGDLHGGWEDEEGMYLFRHATLPWLDNLYAVATRWTGNPLGSSDVLYVHNCGYAEFGFGDALQYLRFVPKIRNLSRGQICLVTATPMQRLFRMNLPADIEVVDPSETAHASGQSAYHVTMMALPKCLGVRSAELRGSPYLRPPLDGPVCGRPADATELHGGIVWAGSSTSGLGRWRSCTLADMAPILGVPGIEWYSLQIPASLPNSTYAKLHQASTKVRDFADTAYLISQMDFVVTVDTSVAHLAGALGAPTYLLVHTQSDWRWGLGSTSPWYDSVRIARQLSLGDWSYPISETASALAALHLRALPNRGSIEADSKNPTTST